MESIENLILKETPNNKACYALLKMLDEQPYECKKWINSTNEEDIKSELNKISNYCINAITNNGQITCEYHHGDNSNGHGRLYGRNSIQHIAGVVRGFLFKHTTDIDMSNCQPTILKYLCNEYKIECPELTHYILNREQIFKSYGKDFVKQTVLKIMNSEFNKKINNEFLNKLDKEMFMIRLKLIAEDDHKKIIEHIDTDEKNYAGKAINAILCDYEARILEKIIYFISHRYNNGYKIITRMFDGCLIDGNHYDNDDLLRKTEEYINIEFLNLNMTLTYKQHDNTIKHDFNFNIFDDVCQEFEKTHCKIINRSCFVKITNNDITYMGINEIKVSYSHLKFLSLDTLLKKPKLKQKSFINEWVDYEHIRKYNDTGIFPPPLKCPDNILNLWVPFIGHELIESFNNKKTDLEFILNHIKGLCNDENDVYDYFIKWMAHMVQNPAQKSTAITLISEEGAGKGTLNILIEKMLGKSKVLQTEDPKQYVFGKFNSLMTTSFFVNLNEVSLKDSQECEGKMKALITDGKLNINEKGKKEYTINSYHRWLITTNNDLGLNKTHENDRRNLIIRSSDKFIGNRQHFDYIYKILDDNDVIATCFNFFLNEVDLTNFNVNDKPFTEYQKDLCELTINPVELFVKDMLMDTNDEFMKFTAKECFDEYKCFCKDNNYEFIGTQVKFGLKLKTLNIDGFDNKHTKKGQVYVFDVQKCKKYFKFDDFEDFEF